MQQSWRRFWPIAVLVVGVLLVGTVHVAVEWWTREPPNYDRIEEGLWLGGYVPEPPPGTRAVLNLCETKDTYHVESHRWDPIRDAEPAPSLDWLREQVAFIEAERAAGHTVYVHCRNGVSRSGMMVVAYLMAREGWTRDQAMAFVRERRQGLRPNPAFRDLLLQWQHALAK
jgi:hypothetical protein